MCFLYLLLGHLFGDFVLQTNKIAGNKVKSQQWNALHTGIVTLCMAIFSIPFGITVNALVLVNGMIHFFIDYLKTKVAEKIPLPGIVYFLLDQSIHILCIYLISLFSIENSMYMLLNFEMIKVLLVMAFVSSFSAILIQYLLMVIFRDPLKNFFHEDEKGMGNLIRVCAVIGFYFSYSFSWLFLLILLTVLMVGIFHFRMKWSTWMKRSYFAAKLSMDITIAFVGFICLIL